MARLLVVDDEEDIREFASNFFRRRRLDVHTAASGEEALDVINRERMDLVLLDLKMEGIDGMETLRRIKQIDDTIKVIMVTGRKPDENNTHTDCMELGAFDYIHKPLQLDELERIVMGALFPSENRLVP
ncbi:MAG: response regulator [Candidatus Omnitrophica bacterium]|nr:response regulator [Candidatus Omnitrophota bacterium]